MKNNVKEQNIDELEMVNGGGFGDIIGRIFGGGTTGALIGLIAGPGGLVVCATGGTTVGAVSKVISIACQ